MSQIANIKYFTKIKVIHLGDIHPSRALVLLKYSDDPPTTLRLAH